MAASVSLPFFQNVTHLELNVNQVGDLDALNHLYPLASLTHLSIVHTDEDLHSGEYHFVPQIQDPRVVTSRYPDRQSYENKNVLRRPLAQKNHYIRQWGQPRLGKAGLDIWEEAEEIVKIQRAKLAAAE
ncbi:hypothetical protein C8J56DRAFT_1054606 [Mycena floridula]|nr:hypothetical protein C8J56DRAFT_1054606 [Mycena floridula]